MSSQETPRSLAASRTSWTLRFETWAVRAIAFCDSPFTDLSLSTSLALILLAMWSLLVLWTAWQPERNGVCGNTFNGGAERQYLPGWTAVPVRNTGGAERT